MERIALLYQKFLDDCIQDEEKKELFQLLSEASDSHLEKLASVYLRREEPADLSGLQEGTDRILEQVNKRIVIPKAGVVPKTRTFQRYLNWRVAAVAAILLIGVISVYISRLVVEQELTEVLSEDIAPGGNRALLTLSNGETIVLDSSKTQLVNLDGTIKYADGASVIAIQDSAVMFTLATPRKGQYQAILPDGTHVWLNAESKISYPSRFEGLSRIVQVEGEVYFEVAKQLGKKFIVQINSGEHVEVLGTHFNINAYPNSNHIWTTLLEGSVRVIGSDQKAVKLKPNQQAIQRKGSTSIYVATVDASKFVAWKNERFNFEGLSFQEAMRQLERWYDIEVDYIGAVPQIEFYGEIGRQNNLQYVINVLRDSGVKLSLKGNKLLIY